MGRLRRPKQLEFPRHAGWGGRRANAGRKPTGPTAGVAHRPRPPLASRYPVHVTVRVARGVWNLRSRRSFRVIGRAIAAGADRLGLRVCAFSVQGNHIHFLCEATDGGALARGMKGLNGRLAKGLNRLMGRKGRVIADRFHSRILRTPTEVKRVLAYLQGNRAHHAKAWGESLPTSYRDPYCSASPGHGVALPAPHTYLLRRERP